MNDCDHAQKIRRLYIGGFLALLCAQLLYGALALSSLHKQYGEPATTLQSMVCKDLASHLSMLVRFGKKLDARTVGTFLNRYEGRFSAANIVVTTAAGEIISSWKPVTDARGTTHTLSLPRVTKKLKDGTRSFSAHGCLWLIHDISNRKGVVIGQVLAGIDEAGFAAALWETVKKQLKLLMLITIGECLLLAVLFRKYAGLAAASHSAAGRRFYLYLCLLLPLVVGHGLFAFFQRGPLQNIYEQEVRHISRQVGRQLAWDFNRLANLGLSVEQIRSLDSALMLSQRGLPVAGMAIFIRDGEMLAAAGSKGPIPEEEWDKLLSENFVSHINFAIPSEDLEHAPSPIHSGGEIVVLGSPDFVKTSLLEITLDATTMTIVAVLFLLELILLLSPREGGAARAPARFMRPIIFVCMFALDLSSLYVPMRIGELGTDLFGLPAQIIPGLPLSCELLMTGIAILYGGFLSQKTGWRPLLMGGTALSCVGAAISWGAWNPLVFILARGFTGIGYGAINIAAQVYVVAHSDSSHRGGNLAFMFAGLYAGSLCGSTMGGLVADHFGYGAVFPVSSVLLLVILLVLYRMLPRDVWTPEPTRHEHLTLRDVLAFVGDRRMGALLALCCFPCALVTVCLAQFFIPLSLSQAGIRPATIGRVFMLFCLVVMFLGPLCGQLIDRARNRAHFLFGAQVMALLSIVALLTTDGLAAATLSIAVLGMCSAIVTNGQAAYALSLPVAVEFGRARTMGIYNVATRSGQVMGPLVLGMASSLWSAHTGLCILAGFLTAAALLFALACFPAPGHTAQIKAKPV